MLSLPPITLRLRGWKLIDRVALAFLLLCSIALGAACGFKQSSTTTEMPAPRSQSASSRAGAALSVGDSTWNVDFSAYCQRRRAEPNNVSVHRSAEHCRANRHYDSR